MSDYDRDALRQLIRDKALAFGEFTLASGKRASYYLDCRQVTLDPQGANLIACGVLERLGEVLPDAVGGMAVGADPITAAVVTVAGQRGLPVKGFIVRKEPKGHGKQQGVEGPVQPGMTCVIVEDVVTTGGSSLRAIERVRRFGMEVVAAIAVVDRLEGGSRAFEAEKVPLYTLFTVRDFGIEPVP